VSLRVIGSVPARTRSPYVPGTQTPGFSAEQVGAPGLRGVSPGGRAAATPDALMLMAHKQYWEDSGTPSGSDDLRHRGLCANVLLTRLQKASDIRYSMRYVAIHQQCAELKPGCRRRGRRPDRRQLQQIANPLGRPIRPRQAAIQNSSSSSGTATAGCSSAACSPTAALLEARRAGAGGGRPSRSPARRRGRAAGSRARRGGGPTSWMPIGRPPALNPTGTLSARAARHRDFGTTTSIQRLGRCPFARPAIFLARAKWVAAS